MASDLGGAGCSARSVRRHYRSIHRSRRAPPGEDGRGAWRCGSGRDRASRGDASADFRMDGCRHADRSGTGGGADLCRSGGSGPGVVLWRRGAHRGAAGGDLPHRRVFLDSNDSPLRLGRIRTGGRWRRQTARAPVPRLVRLAAGRPGGGYDPGLRILFSFYRRFRDNYRSARRVTPASAAAERLSGAFLDRPAHRDRFHRAFVPSQSRGHPIRGHRAHTNHRSVRGRHRAGVAHGGLCLPVRDLHRHQRKGAAPVARSERGRCGALEREVGGAAACGHAGRDFRRFRHADRSRVNHGALRAGHRGRRSSRSASGARCPPDRSEMRHANRRRVCHPGCGHGPHQLPGRCGSAHAGGGMGAGNDRFADRVSAGPQRVPSRRGLPDGRVLGHRCRRAPHPANRSGLRRSSPALGDDFSHQP